MRTRLYTSLNQPKQLPNTSRSVTTSSGRKEYKPIALKPLIHCALLNHQIDYLVGSPILKSAELQAITFVGQYARSQVLIRYPVLKILRTNTIQIPRNTVIITRLVNILTSAIS